MPGRGVAVAGAASAVELEGEGADRRREPGSRRGGECDRAALRIASQPAIRLAEGAARNGGRSDGSRRFVPARLRSGGGDGRPRCRPRLRDRDRTFRRPGAGVARGRSGASGGRAAGAEGARMIVPPSGVRVLVATRPVDFRRGADGLAAIVQTVLRHDPFSGTIYVFRCKRADRVKLLVWDGSGLVLLWMQVAGAPHVLQLALQTGDH